MRKILKISILIQLLNSIQKGVCATITLDFSMIHVSIELHLMEVKLDEILKQQIERARIDLSSLAANAVVPEERLLAAWKGCDKLTEEETSRIQRELDRFFYYRASMRGLIGTTLGLKDEQSI